MISDLREFCDPLLLAKTIRTGGKYMVMPYEIMRSKRFNDNEKLVVAYFLNFIEIQARRLDMNNVAEKDLDNVKAGKVYVKLTDIQEYLDMTDSTLRRTRKGLEKKDVLKTYTRTIGTGKQIANLYFLDVFVLADLLIDEFPTYEPLKLYKKYIDVKYEIVFHALSTPTVMGMPEQARLQYINELAKAAGLPEFSPSKMKGLMDLSPSKMTPLKKEEEKTTSSAISSPSSSTTSSDEEIASRTQTAQRSVRTRPAKRASHDTSFNSKEFKQTYRKYNNLMNYKVGPRGDYDFTALLKFEALTYIDTLAGPRYSLNYDDSDSEQLGTIMNEVYSAIFNDSVPYDHRSIAVTGGRKMDFGYWMTNHIYDIVFFLMSQSPDLKPTTIQKYVCSTLFGRHYDPNNHYTDFLQETKYSVLGRNAVDDNTLQWVKKTAQEWLADFAFSFNTAGHGKMTTEQYQAALKAKTPYLNNLQNRHGDLWFYVLLDSLVDHVGIAITEKVPVISGSLSLLRKREAKQNS